MIPVRGYVGGLRLRLTPLTDPDYRPFSRRIAWLAADADGNPVGSAFLRLNSRESLAHLAELQLNVHPAERRRGAGSQLLGAVVSAARDHDIRTLLADAIADSPADHFLQHHDFALGLTLIYARLRLADANPAVPNVPGYRLVSWRGVVPDELAQTFTDARTGMNDAPSGDIAYGEDPWDVERTRHAAQVIEQRGDHLTTVAAVDESTSAIVGFTELVVPSDGKGDARGLANPIRSPSPACSGTGQRRIGHCSARSMYRSTCARAMLRSRARREVQVHVRGVVEGQRGALGPAGLPEGVAGSGGIETCVLRACPGCG